MSAAKYQVHEPTFYEHSQASAHAESESLINTPKSLKEQFKSLPKLISDAWQNETLPTLMTTFHSKVFRFPKHLEKAFQQDRTFATSLFVRGFLIIAFIGFVASCMFNIQRAITDTAVRTAVIIFASQAAAMFVLLIISLIFWRWQKPILVYAYSHISVILVCLCLFSSAFPAPDGDSFGLVIVFASICIGMPVFSTIEVLIYFFLIIIACFIIHISKLMEPLDTAKHIITEITTMVLCLNIYFVIAEAERKAFLTRYLIERQSQLIQRENEKNKLLLLNILPAKIVDILQDRHHDETASQSNKSEDVTDAIIHEYYADATIMFVKIVDFSKITKHLQASEIIQLLNQVFSELDVISENHKLYRIKTIGFTYMCTSGVPDAMEGHLDNAVSAALDMLETFKAKHIGKGLLEKPVEITIGINSGPVVAGVIGNKSLAYDVWSDSVNVSARMVYYSAPGAILINQNTYNKLLYRERYQIDGPALVAVKGKGDMNCYSIIGKTTTQDDFSSESSTHSLKKQPEPKKSSCHISFNHSRSVMPIEEEKHQPLLTLMSEWANASLQDERDKEFMQGSEIHQFEKYFNFEYLSKLVSSKFMGKMPGMIQYFNPILLKLKSTKMELHYRKNSYKIGHRAVQRTFLIYFLVFLASVALEACDIELHKRTSEYPRLMITIFAVLTPIYLVMLIITLTPLITVHFFSFYGITILYMLLLQGGVLAIGFVYPNSTVLFGRILAILLVSAPMIRVPFGIRLLLNTICVMFGVILELTKTVSFGFEWIYIGVMFMLCGYTSWLDEFKLSGDFFLRVLDYKKRKVFEAEQQQSKELLLNILPQTILDSIGKADTGSAKYFEMVGVLFCDIHHFTVLAGSLKPIELVQMLSDLFSAFDDISRKYEILKIKTIGDCYQCASGIISTNRDHLHGLAHMAIEMLEFVVGYKKIEMRFGVHCGSAVGGIVGLTRFAFDLYGSTVDMASHMEQTGKEMKVHCSEDFYYNVNEAFEFETREDEVLNMKGTKMQSYFLKSPKK